MIYIMHLKFLFMEWSFLANNDPAHAALVCPSHPDNPWALFPAARAAEVVPPAEVDMNPEVHW